MPVKKIWYCIKGLIHDYAVHKIPTLSAALAYYTLFSIAPIILIVIFTLGQFIGAEKIKSQIIVEISNNLGPGTAALISNIIDAISKPKDTFFAYVTGGILLLIGATGIFSEIQNGLNTIWDVPLKSDSWFHFVKGRFFSFLMVLSIGFVFLASMILSLVLTGLSEFLPFYWIEIDTGIYQQYIVSFLVFVLLFALMFKMLPDVYMQWKDVWFGASITSALYILGKIMLASYLHHTQVASLYGVSSSLIILLIWVYYSAQIFFIGAEITKTYVLHKEKRIILKDDFD